jgi:hypothetical protein
MESPGRTVTMLHASPQELCRIWRVVAVLASTFAWVTSQAADSLWVENPVDVAYSVGEMTKGAQDIGLTTESFAESLHAMLNHAGLQPRQSTRSRDSDVLFLDVIVDGESFYTSAGFWRMANYPLPNGDLNSEFVTVWQDYSIGAHHNNPDIVRASVNTILERFIAKYSDANNTRRPMQVASTP